MKVERIEAGTQGLHSNPNPVTLMQLVGHGTCPTRHNRSHLARSRSNPAGVVPPMSTYLGNDFLNHLGLVGERHVVPTQRIIPVHKVRVGRRVCLDLRMVASGCTQRYARTVCTHAWRFRSTTFKLYSALRNAEPQRQK